MCACAALLSVQFTASTLPRNSSASLVTEPGSAESLVWNSAMTTNSPCEQPLRAAGSGLGHAIHLPHARLGFAPAFHPAGT